MMQVKGTRKTVSPINSSQAFLRNQCLPDQVDPDMCIPDVPKAQTNAKRAVCECHSSSCNSVESKGLNFSRTKFVWGRLES
ncbi:MAG: hypothetical protein CM1200mP41_06730 [Gammaproteobacteria bacterium]|nr:MAG: hypothetical protein CM1200mP41_06730 [Gammaproteobacteria bacterium]